MYLIITVSVAVFQHHYDGQYDNKNTDDHASEDEAG